MVKNVKYGSLSLPRETLEDLKLWRQAFCVVRGSNVSFVGMVGEMLEGLRLSNPGVSAEYERIKEIHERNAAGEVGER